jgi:hypothetical protein
MALALEGLAGSLHAGRLPPAEDLALAANTLGQVWEAGPPASLERSAEFDSAWAEFMLASQACARGSPREVAQVERSAQTLALQLRWTSQDVDGPAPRSDLPPSVRKSIARLSSRYARFGLRRGVPSAA